MIQILINLVLWFITSVMNFFGVLIYGKLPKVSMYHLWELEGNYSVYDFYNNKNIQSIKNPVMNEKMVLDLLYEVVKDCDELSDEIPIRDKKGEIYGEESLYCYLKDKFENKMKNY